MFDRIEKYFDKLNVPVIMGEFACDDKDNTQDRVNVSACVEAAKE